MQRPTIRISQSGSALLASQISELCNINPSAQLPSFFEYVDLESVVGTEMINHRKEYKAIAPSRAQRLASFGDIFYQMVRPYQKNNYLFEREEGHYVFSTGYAQLRPYINSRYLFCLLQSNTFVAEVIKNCTGSSYPAINSTILSKIKVVYTNDVKEQQAIADFFQSLDSMITLTSKKIEKLKQTLTGCMQTMFPQEGELEPKIRFNEFEGEWKSIPLKAFAKKKMEKNVGIKYNITLTNSAEYGVINQRDFFDHDISNSNSIGGYYIINNDDFVYNPRISITAPVGPINRNQLGYTGIMSPLYLIFSVAGINKDFLSYFFKTTLWYNYMKLNGNSGARFDRLAISDDDFFNMPIAVPLDSKEQLRIANYFKSLNEMISLLSKRLDLLKHIKSACLDNMFV